MFPFRRNGPKKRGKGGGANGGGGRRHHDNGGGAGRRVPGSAGELLSTMQSSTKALAQMLAGNTKMSGQLAHARGVLAQANRLVDERQPDRLPPAERERFFHCLALLKLTVTDAEEAATAEEMAPEPTARPAVPLDAERLRDVARRLASPTPCRRRLWPHRRHRTRTSTNCPDRATLPAATPCRRPVKRQRSRAPATSPAQARDASGCASSRFSAGCRAPSPEAWLGLSGLGRWRYAIRSRRHHLACLAPNCRLSDRAIGLCSGTAAGRWNRATWR